MYAFLFCVKLVGRCLWLKVFLLIIQQQLRWGGGTVFYLTGWIFNPIFGGNYKIYTELIMTELLKKIERDAECLTTQERVYLAERLMSSIDDDVKLDDFEMEWIAKEQGRYDDYHDI